MPTTTTTIERAAPAATDAPPAEPRCTESVHTSLEHLSELYAYNHWIFSQIRGHLAGSICEVGGGIGNITQFLLNYPRVVSLEPAPQAFEFARKRFRDHLNVTVVQAFLEECPVSGMGPQSFDTVICLNVLEHIEDDVGALRKMGELCRADGKVVVLVPAMMALFGEMDRSFGHYRRYSRRSLGQAFRAAGFRVIHSRYFNMAGAFGWWWRGRIAKADQLDSNSCRTFDRLVPYLDAVERLIRPPFGQSLVVVGSPQYKPRGERT